MPVVAIQVVPDRFDSIQSDMALGSGQGRASSGPHVRRPTRGIVLKEDTFATIRVVAQSDNSPVHLIDAGTNRKIGDGGEFLEVNGKRMTDVYSNFLLQSIQEERAEKQQIIETFGEPFIFLFGERARIMHFSGILVNSFDFNWEAEWWENYELFLRGTRCVENDARIYLAFDETLINGYIINSQSQKVAQERSYVQFTFSLFVTGYSNFSKIGDPNAFQGDADPIGHNEADTSAFRPTLLIPNEVLSRNALLDGKLDTNAISLAEGLVSQGIRAVTSAFSAAQATVNAAIQNVGNAITGAGDIVRVPFGFAGAVAFDDDPAVIGGNIKPGVATYTVFSDNADEFVGTSSQYGTSFLPHVSFENQADNDVTDKELMQRAKSVWEANGFTVESSDVSKLINQVHSGITVGLEIASATKALSAVDFSAATPAAISPLVGGRAGGQSDIEG